MASETLNITVVEDNGATNRLVTAVNNLAQASDNLGDATERSAAVSRTANTARSQEADTTARATTAAKGYIDAQGNYIRLVGSQANGVKAAVTSQQSLTQAVSATTIEAGRAAAGYGPLNAATASAGATNAAFNARVRELNAALTGTVAPAQAAAAGAAAIAPAVQGAGTATQTANGWIAQYRQSLYGVAPAGQAAATGARAAGGGIGGSGNDASNATGKHVSLANAMRGVGSAASGLASSLSALGIGLAAAAVIKYSDSYTSVQNKLRLVTIDQGKLNDIMKVSYDIAQRTATPLDAIATLYGKISQSATAYRLSSQDVAAITSSLALSFQASGSSSAEAGRAIEQFTQGLSKGKLELEDFKDMISSAPAVVNAMTAGLRMMGVSVTGGLGPALSQGTVTAKQMLDALVMIQPTMQTFASGAIPTVSQALTRLSNAFEYYIGNSQQGHTATTVMINALGGLANNLNIVVPAAVAVGAVLSFGMIAGAISSVIGLAGAFVTLTAAMIANPLVVAGVAAALTVAAGAAYYFRDSIGSTVSSLLGLNPQTDTTTAATAKLKSAFDALQPSGNAVAATHNKITAASAAQSAQYNQLGEKMESFSTILQRWNAQAQAQAQHIQEVSQMLQQYYYINDAANNAVVELNATVGLFIGTIDNANARLSQGQSALSSYAQGLSSLSASYGDAAAAANNFASAAERSNTVAGQIGTSSGTGNDITGFVTSQMGYGGSLLGLSAQELHSNQLSRLRSLIAANPYNSAFRQAYLQELNAGNAGTQYSYNSSGQVVRSTAGFATGGTFIVGNDNQPQRNVEHFASGGSFMVGGAGSTDSQLVQFMASPNERVTIETPSQVMPRSQRTIPESRVRSGKTNINLVFKTDDYGQFQRSSKQIAQDFGTRIAKSVVGG